MTEEDRILELLLAIASDAFPEVFARDPEEPVELRLMRGWLPGGRFSAREHRSYAEFMEAVADDPQLSMFAPPSETFITSSNGHGSLVQTGALLSLLIASASAVHVAKGKRTDDLDAFLEEVASTFRSFRSLIAGEEEEGLTILAFAGLTLREGTRIETPWGVLRAAGELEAGNRPSNVTPTVILTSPRPVRFRLGEPEVEPNMDYYKDIQKAIDRPVELFPLAALLGIERDDYVLPSFVWSTSAEPVLASAAYQVAPLPGRQARLAVFHRFSSPQTGGEALTADEERRLSEWAELVDSRYDPAIQIAARRTISAILERADPSDALIDAVMATENLFGHGGTTEVAFRVTTALALLLESEPEKRSTLRAELGKVYDVRSAVVHGAEITPKMKLVERKEEAIRIAVHALRALFEERPHLIVDRERGMRLLLGAADVEA